MPLLALLFLGCSKDPIVTVYNNAITTSPVKCLRLSIIPKNQMIHDILTKKYTFDSSCDTVLDVSTKSEIKCNSPYSASKRTMTNFPSAYLKMEIRKGMTLQYGYFVDLTSKPDASDVSDAFDRIVADLQL